MTKTQIGATDESGVHSRLYKTGESYSAPQDISLSVAKIFVSCKFAELEEEEIEKSNPIDTLKAQQDALMKANGRPPKVDEEVIDIDEDEEEDEGEEEDEETEKKKVPEKPLFNKYNNSNNNKNKNRR